MEKYKLFTGGVFVRDPEMDIHLEKPYWLDNYKNPYEFAKEKKNVVKAKILLTLITVFIIIPISTLPLGVIIYTAYIYNSMLIAKLSVIAALLGCMLGYILFLLIKDKFFEILD